jgi:hypothetical protein
MNEKCGMRARIGMPIIRAPATTSAAERPAAAHEPASAATASNHSAASKTLVRVLLETKHRQPEWPQPIGDVYAYYEDGTQDRWTTHRNCMNARMGAGVHEKCINGRPVSPAEFANNLIFCSGHLQTQ